MINNDENGAPQVKVKLRISYNIAEYHSPAEFMLDLYVTLKIFSCFWTKKDG